MKKQDKNKQHEDVLEAKFFEGMKQESAKLAQAAMHYKKGNTAYEAQQMEEAFRAFRAAAENGYAKAIYMIGMMYLQGEYVEKDTAEALRYFRAAALQGDVKAMAKLGYCYKYGELLEKDETLAVSYYERAKIQSEVLLGYDEADRKEYEELQAAGYRAIDFHALNLKKCRDEFANEDAEDAAWDISIARPYSPIIDTVIEKCEQKAMVKFGSTLKAWHMEDHKSNSFSRLKDLLFQACMFDMEWMKTLSDQEVLEILQFLYDTSHSRAYYMETSGEEQKKEISSEGENYLLEDVLAWQGKKYAIATRKDVLIPDVRIFALVAGEWRHVDEHAEVYGEIFQSYMEMKCIDRTTIWYEIEKAYQLEQKKESMPQEEYQAAEQQIRANSRFMRWYPRPYVDAIKDYKTKNERHIMASLFTCGELKEQGLPRMLTPFNHSKVIDIVETEENCFWILVAPKNILGKAKAKPQVWTLSYAKERPKKAKKPIIEKLNRCKVMKDIPENVRVRFGMRIKSCLMQGDVLV